MNAQLVRLNGGEKIDGKFLYFALAHPATKTQFMSLKTGTALQQLPIGKLMFTRLPIPLKEEQNDIGNTLWLVEESRLILERKLTTMNELFRTLLHELMTGRRRVCDVNLAALNLNPNEQ
jgi:type I restriction enzyme S subunit